MTDIQDHLTEPKTGKKWIPQQHTENLVYCRADYFGHIQHAAFKITDGQMGTKIIKTFSTGPEATRYIREHSEGLPQTFVPSATREILKPCDPCQENIDRAVQADNVARLNESRRKIINLKEGISDVNTD